MKKYFDIFLSGRRYRIEIDEELDKSLRKSLKDNYQFENNILKLNTTDKSKTYLIKTKVINNLLNLIKTYELDPELEKRIDYLKKQLNVKRNTIYENDLKKLEELLNETTNIYGTVRTTLLKKDQAKIIKEQNEAIEEAINEKFSDTIEESSNDTSANIEDVREILNKLKEDVDLAELIDDDCIEEALANIIICKNMDEYLEVSSREKNVTDINELIEGANFKKEKIIIPPNTSLKKVITKLVTSSYFKDADKIITSDIQTFDDELKDLLATFKRNISIDFNASNLEYYSKKFINNYKELCLRYNKDANELFRGFFKGENNALKDFFRNLNINYENLSNMVINSLLQAGVNKKVLSKSYLDRLISMPSSAEISSSINNINSTVTNSNTINSNSTINSSSTINSTTTNEINSKVPSDLTTNTREDITIEQNSRATNNLQTDLNFLKNSSKKNGGEVPQDVNSHMFINNSMASQNFDTDINLHQRQIRVQNKAKMTYAANTSARGVYRKNNSFNQAVYIGENISEEDNGFSTTSTDEYDTYTTTPAYDEPTSLTTSSESAILNDLNNNDLPNNINLDDLSNNDSIEELQNKDKKELSNQIWNRLKKSPTFWFTVGGIAFFLLLILCIMGGVNQNKNTFDGGNSFAYNSMYYEANGNVASFIGFWEGIAGKSCTINNLAGHTATDIGDGAVSVGAGVTNAVVRSSDTAKYLEQNNMQSYFHYSNGTYYMEIGDCIPDEAWQEIKAISIGNFASPIDTIAAELGIELTQYQKDALTSFNYNLGAGYTRNLLTAYKNGSYEGLWAEMSKYYHSSNDALYAYGLKRRRKSEFALFVTGDYTSDVHFNNDQEYYDYNFGGIMDKIPSYGSSSSEFLADTSGYLARLTRPYRSNSYFYNQQDENQYAYTAYEGECSWYAGHRAKEILAQNNINKSWWSMPDGGSYCNVSEVTSGAFKSSSDINSPRIGSLIVWTDAGSYGHVAVVEKVNSDGSILVSEASITLGYLGGGARSALRAYSGNIYNARKQNCEGNGSGCFRTRTISKSNIINAGFGGNYRFKCYIYLVD